jgi:hypothetical protein
MFRFSQRYIVYPQHGDKMSTQNDLIWGVVKTLQGISGVAPILWSKLAAATQWLIRKPADETIAALMRSRLLSSSMKLSRIRNGIS